MNLLSPRSSCASYWTPSLSAELFDPRSARRGSETAQGGLWLAPGRRRTLTSISRMAEEGFPRGVSAPATRALHGAGYRELNQLADVPAADLAKLHGMGPKAVAVLQQALEERGLTLG